MALPDSMSIKLSSMSAAELKSCWDALESYDSNQSWGDGFSMDDWCEAVYSEMSARNIVANLS